MSQAQALDRFLASVEKKAYCHAEFAVKHQQEALDLVQEVMMAFVKHYADTAQEQWPALFHRVLQNKIRDWYRRNKVRSLWRGWFSEIADGHQEQLENQPSTQRSEPQDNVQNNELSHRLVQEIEQLPLRQQQAFLLRHLDGLSVKETASAMACSEGSVKTHLSRAVQRLQTELGDWNE